MKPLVIDYLQTHTLAQLEEEHGVCARPNSHLDKFSLNYDQILTRSGDTVAEQCRGMVVRPSSGLVTASNWKDVCLPDLQVLAWPMSRFYNHGDSAAAQVDWADPGLRIYEKLDGTMIACYWDPLHGRWYAATRSVPEADLPIYKGHLEIGDTTYGDLFFRALLETRAHVQEGSAKNAVPSVDPATLCESFGLLQGVTYVFELVSPWNQVVVAYPHPRVYLLAARDPWGHELPIELLRVDHVLRPQTWAINDPIALTAFVDSTDPAKLEGAVACDSAFRRVKVKNKTWVLASRSKDTVTASPRSALESIIMEKVDDVVALVPKSVGDELLRMQWAYGRFCKQTDERYRQFTAEASGSRKEFAIRVTGSKAWNAPYFSMWEGRAPDARTWIRTMCEAGKLTTPALDAILSGMGW